MRKRYVFPGSKGSVAFSLNPTADVTADGFVPDMGPRYVAFCAKYIRAESRKDGRCFSLSSGKSSTIITRTRYGFGSPGIGYTDELFDEDRVFVMIPVS